MERNRLFPEKGTGESETNDAAADEPELRATVRLEKQAKVDSEAIEKIAEPGPDHPFGMTLAGEEQWEAREREKANTRERRRTQSSLREQGSRASVDRVAEQRRRRWHERAASVDPAFEPGPDPREQLSSEELAAVNQEAERITNGVREPGSRAAVSRRLAGRVARGASLLSASVAVMEAERTRAGTVVPIGDLEDIPRNEVSIEGEVVRLFDASSPAIEQAGLIEDETGRVKFTSWVKSRPRIVCEGDRVRLRLVATNWYQGRVSVAVTGDSRIVFVDER
jgi:hypothetical protein